MDEEKLENENDIAIEYRLNALNKRLKAIISNVKEYDKDWLDSINEVLTGIEQNILDGCNSKLVDNNVNKLLLKFRNNTLRNYISKSKLSEKTSNCLFRSGIILMYELVIMDIEDIAKLRWMGAVKLKEIEKELSNLDKIDTVGLNILKYAKWLVTAIDFSNSLKDCYEGSSLCKIVYEVLLTFDELGAGMDSISKHEKVISSLYRKEYTKELLRTYIENLEHAGYSIKDNIPNHLNGLDCLEQILKDVKVISSKKNDLMTIMEYIDKIENQNKAYILRQRIQGKTLVDIAKDVGLTPERVRQVTLDALRKKPLLKDDAYRKVFERYNMTLEQFTYIFQKKPETYNYLKIVYTKGKKSIDSLLEDDKLHTDIRKRAKKFVKNEYVFINNSYSRISKESIIDTLLKSKFNDETSIDYFVDEYNRVIKELGINNKKFELNKSSFMNILLNKRNVIWKYPKTLRYYDMDNREFSTLVNNLGLDGYNNVIISTHKFFSENTELMAVYDIRDEYELHNILKKVYKRKSIDYTRTPNIRFGDATIEGQIESLIRELMPIRITKFVKEYESRYGGLQESIRGSYSEIIAKYSCAGELCINTNVDNTALSKLDELLKDDFYFIDDIIEIYNKNINRYGKKPLDIRSLKNLGFKICSEYAIRKTQGTFVGYVKQLLTNKDIINIGDIDNRILGTRAFCVEFLTLKKQYKLIEIEKQKYVTKKYLDKRGIKKKDITEFCDKAFNSALDNEYFTLKSIRNRLELNDGNKFETFGLGETFCESLIKYDGRFGYTNVKDKMIACKNKEKSIHYKFVEQIIGNSKGVSIGGILKIAREQYGIRLDRHRVVDNIRNNEKLLYNKETGIVTPI